MIQLSDNSDDTTNGTFRLTVILVVAVLAQAVCWSFGSPAMLRPNLTQDYYYAAQSVLISFVTLFVLPMIACFLLKIDLPSIGLKVGDWKFGTAVLGVGIATASVGLFLGCNDAQIKNAYPWPGEWLSLSMTNMFAWFVIYGLFYVAFEFFYRGFLLRGLQPHIGLTAAVWIQAIMSVLIHIGRPTVELLICIPAAFVFAWIAIKTRSIFYVIGLHWAIGILNDIFSMYYKDWI